MGFVARLVGCFGIVYVCALVLFVLKHYRPQNPLSAPSERIESNVSDNSRYYAEQSAYAFATLVCEDQSLLQTATMIISLLKQSPPTRAKIIPLLTPGVSKSTCDALKSLAPPVQCLWVEIVDYPYPASIASRSLNKPCRYTKLRAWGLIEYDHVILIDSDTLVLESLDHLFTLPTRDVVYAVADVYPKIFNSGFVLLSPSTHIATALVEATSWTTSYNKGDQGFLNNFFAERNRERTSPASDDFFVGNTRQPFVPLDAKYNFPTWLANSYFGKSLFPNFPMGVAVLHFAGEVKPWLLAGDQKAFGRFYEPRAFLKWWQEADEAAGSLGCVVRSWDETCGVEMCFNHTRCRSDACIDNVDLYASRRFDHVEDALTVVLSTFDGSRLPVEGLVHHYVNSSIVARVVIVWHNPSVAPKMPARRVVNRKQVTTLWQAYDSLNNRFLPFDVTTKTVLICDDDIFVSLDELGFAFDVSRQHPDKLVSPFVRASRLIAAGNNASHSLGYFERDWSFSFEGARRYSLALTKFSFAPAWLLFTYSCLLDPTVYAYVNKVNNCEDVAFNILAAATGLTAPLMVDIAVMDYGHASGLSKRLGHLRQRGGCVNDLSFLISGPRKRGSRLLPEASTASSRFVSTRVQYQAAKSRPGALLPTNLAPRLVLQHDQAVTVSIIEDCSIYGAGRRSKFHQPHNLTVLSGMLESTGSDGVPYARFYHGLLETPSFMPDRDNFNSPRTQHENPHWQPKLFGEIVTLIKLKRIDLEKANVKDENRGVLLLDLVLSKPIGILERYPCPMRVFYLPKFPENWTCHAMTYEGVLDLLDAVSDSGFLYPLVSVNSLVLFNLKAIDNAFRRGSARILNRRRPVNVTLALFQDTETAKTAKNNELDCNFSHSRGPVSCFNLASLTLTQALPYFQLVLATVPYFLCITF